jgi:hypothetical protein
VHISIASNDIFAVALGIEYDRNHKEVRLCQFGGITLHSSLNTYESRTYEI